MGLLIGSIFIILSRDDDERGERGGERGREPGAGELKTSKHHLHTLTLPVVLGLLRAGTPTTVKLDVI